MIFSFVFIFIPNVCVSRQKVVWFCWIFFSNFIWMETKYVFLLLWFPLPNQLLLPSWFFSAVWLQFFHGPCCFSSSCVSTAHRIESPDEGDAKYLVCFRPFCLLPFPFPSLPPFFVLQTTEMRVSPYAHTRATNALQLKITRNTAAMGLLVIRNEPLHFSKMSHWAWVVPHRLMGWRLGIQCVMLVRPDSGKSCHREHCPWNGVYDGFMEWLIASSKSFWLPLLPCALSLLHMIPS